MAPKTVTLRNDEDDLGTRYLGAKLTPEGDVWIEGQDLGDGVEKFFGKGIREYEWVWTIVASDVAALLAALGTKAHVLSALKKRFSDENAIHLEPFLQEHGVPYEFWSRMGD